MIHPLEFVTSTLFIFNVFCPLHTNHCESHFCLFNHRKLFVCCAKKVTGMEIVCWLAERRESSTFPLPLPFLVASTSHVHSCFEKQVLTLCFFDGNSWLRVRGAPGLSEKSDSEKPRMSLQPLVGKQRFSTLPIPSTDRCVRQNLLALGIAELGWSQSSSCSSVLRGGGRSS